MVNDTPTPLRSRPAFRGAVAGLAGGVAWFVSLLLFFGPAQLILADPQLQSEKMLAVFHDEPLPRIAAMPWVLIIALLCIGVMWGWVYVWLTKPGRPGYAAAADDADGTWAAGTWWKRGLRFGVVGWVLMVPWFAFYLPWNALLEPTLLVLLEAVCWAGVMLAVGVTIARVDSLLWPRPLRGNP